jgi:hypothetical protein
MNRSRTSAGLALPVAAIVLAVVALSAFVGGTVAGRRGDPTPPLPSVPASPTPSAQPSPTPTPEPTDGPSDGKVEVDLENLLGDDVSVVIEDRTGMLVEATSGRPGDGMSTRWFDMKVENLDDQTLRVTWVGLPGDAEVGLSISRVDGELRLRMVQPGPPAQSDALGYDRELVLEFDAPVDADDVLTSIQEGLDTDD